MSEQKRKKKDFAHTLSIIYLVLQKNNKPHLQRKVMKVFTLKMSEHTVTAIQFYDSSLH